MRKIIVAITGASGTRYGADLLAALNQAPAVETHLVISQWGIQNLKLETNLSLADLENLADHVYKNQDLGASIASGSFLTDSMVIVPASMRTTAAIAAGLSDDLITRSADVMLKERRQLILVPRETPLSAIHLENMLKLARLGVQMIPPMPAFYNQPQTIDDLIAHQTNRTLDALGVAVPGREARRWEGI